MIPNIEEARGLLKEYNKGDFHLLHDIDFGRYPEEHCSKCCELLRTHDVDEQILH